MPRLVFDIEADGLLDDVTKLHCLVIKDADTGEQWSCWPFEDDVSKPYHTLVFGLGKLMEADEIIGHNIIKYDVPAIQKLYPWFNPTGTVTDTLVQTRLIWSNIKMGDIGRAKRKTFPGKLIGSHSLEAWGYRLGAWKGDYSKEREAWLRDIHEKQGIDPPTDEQIRVYVWGEWNQEMQDYCEQDVEVTAQLFERIEGKNYAQRALDLEHDAANLCAKIERNGYPFNEAAAAALYGTLSGMRANLEQELKETFGSWYEPDGEWTPKRPIPEMGEVGEYVYVDFAGNEIDDVSGYLTPRGALNAEAKREDIKRVFKGNTMTRLKLIEFNPASRQHIANRLKKLYGWEPQDFTPGGDPKIDETILEGLDYPTAPLLNRYFLVQKRIGQIAEGKQAWLRVVKDGKVHGSINPNGAVTGRATHSFPNVAQVPKVQMDKEGNIKHGLDGGYGFECRSLFTVPPGWTQIGTDMSGLELRCLSHFMAKWDGGAYGDLVLNGDIHTANQTAAGLPSRDDSKTFIYAFLYGAGDGKLGSITGKGAKEGKRLRANFEAQIPAMGNLSKAVKVAAKRGYLVGLDGRHLHVRSEHAALNTLLQSAGALLCKQWMVLLEQKLLDRGYIHGWDGDFAFLAWVHDEVQVAAKTKELADEIGQLSIECAREAGELFDFRCPLTADYKIGANWAECH